MLSVLASCSRDHSGNSFADERSWGVQTLAVPTSFAVNPGELLSIDFYILNEFKDGLLVPVKVKTLSPGRDEDEPHNYSITAHAYCWRNDTLHREAIESRSIGSGLELNTILGTGEMIVYSIIWLNGFDRADIVRLEIEVGSILEVFEAECTVVCKGGH